MVAKNTKLVNPKGSSLTFSAQGGRGKEKNSVAKKFSVGSEGAAEFPPHPPSAAPERIEPRHLPEYLEGRTPKKNVLSIFRKNRARANPKSKRHFSLVSAEALRGGGGASSFALEVGSSKVYNYSTSSNFLKMGRKTPLLRQFKS